MRASSTNRKMPSPQKRNPQSAQMIESLMSSGYGAAPPSVPKMNDKPVLHNVAPMRTEQKSRFDIYASDTSTRDSSTHYSWGHSSTSGRTFAYSHSNWAGGTVKSRQTNTHANKSSRPSSTTSHARQNTPSQHTRPSRYRKSAHTHTNVDMRSGKNQRYHSKIKDTSHAPYIPTSEDCEILRNALVSLYRDRLRPCKVDLSRRLKQFGATEELLARYREAYENIMDYEVDVDDNGKPIILLAFPPKDFTGFVDLTDPNDPYPEEMWRAFAEYVTGLLSVSKAHSSSNADASSVESTPADLLSEGSAKTSDAISIASESRCEKLKNKHAFTRPYQYRGGRYGMAEEMYSRNLSFLRGRALGEVCHIVELAIKKGLLAYENELLQPVSACMRITTASLSAQGVKLQEYMSNQDLGFPHLRENGSPVETLQEAREVVAEFIQPWPQGIHISKLKYNILGNRNVYISPTMFGHTRLSTLLSSEAFSDICRVIHKSNNHILVQSVGYKKPDNVPLFVSSKGKDMELKVLSPESLWRGPDMTEIPYKWATMMLDCAKQACEEEISALEECCNKRANNTLNNHNHNYNNEDIDVNNNHHIHNNNNKNNSIPVLINNTSIEEEEEDADIPVEFDDDSENENNIYVYNKKNSNINDIIHNNDNNNHTNVPDNNNNNNYIYKRQHDHLARVGVHPVDPNAQLGVLFEKTVDLLVQAFSKPVGSKWAVNAQSETQKHNSRWQVFASSEIGEVPCTDDESSRRSSPAQLPIIQLFGTSTDYSEYTP